MHALDNVIWQALNTCQIHLGQRNAQAAKFHKDVSLLGGFTEPSFENYQSLSQLLAPGERVGLFLDTLPQPPPGWRIVVTLPLLEMVCENGSPQAYAPNNSIVPLGEADVPEMLALTKLTKPGPFATRTREMGDYFGIRVNSQLVAMAGERLRIPGYTEVSAVCTHPDHLGHGYATGLVSLVMQRILDRGERPFLHVRGDNERAIALYERLGFHRCPPLHYAILEKVAESF
ncbi:MAG TPA: GNAT family N-acetyltransferase [Terriglobales bacterium]|nr:GNAT family N-acetyltransferase [Terriglobales bacterium]